MSCSLYVMKLPLNYPVTLEIEEIGQIEQLQVSVLDERRITMQLSFCSACHHLLSSMHTSLNVGIGTFSFLWWCQPWGEPPLPNLPVDDSAVEDDETVTPPIPRSLNIEAL